MKKGKRHRNVGAGSEEILEDTTPKIFEESLATFDKMVFNK